MKYIVSLLSEVNFHPQTEAEEVIQNVRTILTTRLGTVPLHRDFGLTWEHIDKPLPVAKSLIHGEIIDAINEFEPRARVEAVEFEADTLDAMEGILRPRVIISFGDDNGGYDETAARALRVASPATAAYPLSGGSSSKSEKFLDCGTATPIIGSIGHDCGNVFEMTDKILDCGRADSFAR